MIKVEGVVQLPMWNEREAVITAGPHNSLLIFKQLDWEKFFSQKLAILETPRPREVLSRFFTIHARIVDVKNNCLSIPEILVEWMNAEVNSHCMDKVVIEKPRKQDIYYGYCSYVIHKSL